MIRSSIALKAASSVLFVCAAVLPVRAGGRPVTATVSFERSAAVGEFPVERIVVYKRKSGEAVLIVEVEQNDGVSAVQDRLFLDASVFEALWSLIEEAGLTLDRPVISLQPEGDVGSGRLRLAWNDVGDRTTHEREYRWTGSFPHTSELSRIESRLARITREHSAKYTLCNFREE